MSVASLVVLLLLVASGMPRTAEADDEPKGLSVSVDGTVAAPLPLVRSTLLDLDSFPSWFPALGFWRILGRDGDSAVIHGGQDLPWPVSDRDYVVRYSWWTGEDGAFHLEARALAGADPPAADGRVRVEEMRTLWRLHPDGERTRVTYEYEGSTGIPLPGWVAKIGWRSRTGVLIEALAEEVARRQAEDAQAPSP